MIKSRKFYIYQTVISIILMIFTLIIVLPIILLFMASITSEKALIVNGYSFFPSEFSLEAYRYIWINRGTIFRAYSITIFITLTGTFVNVLISAMSNISVCLPSLSFEDMYRKREEIYVPGMKFQVLYLLHGGSGDDSDFIHFSNIVRYADEHKIVVIMPCDYNACYTDAEGSKFYTYLVEELPNICRTMFPISDKREDTFIGGLSMGAHGAMKIAVNHPERYQSVLLMSGSSYRPGVPSFVPTKAGVFDLQAVPRDSPNPVERKFQDPAFIQGTVDDVYEIAENNIKTKKPLPEFFFLVGDCDHAYYRVQLAERELREWGYKTRFEVEKGYGHEWDLWDLGLRRALKEWLPIRHGVIYPDNNK